MSASEGPLLFAYECVSLPGAFVGFQINDLVWNTFAANHNPWLLARTEWIWTSHAGRSWLLGWALFIGTSAWWALLGWGAATAHKRLRRRAREAGDNTEPDNKALHQTRRGGVALFVRRGPVVEARLAGEGWCSTDLEEECLRR